MSEQTPEDSVELRAYVAGYLDGVLAAGSAVEDLTFRQIDWMERRSRVRRATEGDAEEESKLEP